MITYSRVSINSPGRLKIPLYRLEKFLKIPLSLGCFNNTGLLQARIAKNPDLQRICIKSTGFHGCGYYYCRKK